MTISNKDSLKTDIERMKDHLLSIAEPDRLHIIGEALSQINAGKAILNIAGCAEWDIRVEYRKKSSIGDGVMRNLTANEMGVR